MRNQLCFSTFDPLFSDAPSLCDICDTKPSVFHFESCSSENNPACRAIKGYCCAACATRLLDQLQDAESLAWAQEEASVQKDGVDVSELHSRRLATFGAQGRN
jgi:hypothetical protein